MSGPPVFAAAALADTLFAGTFVGALFAGMLFAGIVFADAGVLAGAGCGSTGGAVSCAHTNTVERRTRTVGRSVRLNEGRQPTNLLHVKIHILQMQKRASGSLTQPNQLTAYYVRLTVLRQVRLTRLLSIRVFNGGNHCVDRGIARGKRRADAATPSVVPTDPDSLRLADLRKPVAGQHVVSDSGLNI